MPLLKNWASEQEAGKEIDPRAKNSIELVRRTMMGLASQLDEHRETLASYTLVRTAKIDGSRAARNSNRVLENRVAAIAEEQRLIQEIYKSILEYIQVLDKHSVRNCQIKTKLLKMRYIDRLEWSEINRQVYGQNPDYNKKRTSYMRKMHRMVGAAYREIFFYWKG